MNKIDVVILAAGKGTRMFSETPKVLHKIAGKEMLRFVCESVDEICEKAVVVVGHKKELVEETMRDLNLDFVYQNEQLGTAHAVKQAIDKLSKDITLILYGDCPLIEKTTLKSVLELAKINQACVLTANFENPFGYGRIVKDVNGCVVKIVEEKDANETERAITEVNSGIIAVKTDLLREFLNIVDNNNAQNEYYLTDIFSFLNSKNIKAKSFVVANKMEIFGINDKVQLNECERYYQEKFATNLMKQGTTIIDKQRFDVRNINLNIGKDCIIAANVVLEGNINIGNNVSIGENAIIINSTVGDNVIIKPFSIIENSTIGDFSDVGPFARLRPGNKIHQKVHIGNFVEVKNTEIFNGAKVGHLTYLGDSEIGSNANIGAGTITCNYDGANKFKTLIGENAFIGSNSSLVAPVEIGENATIAAGSTITENVENNVLALARSRQMIKKDFKRPQKINK